MRSGDIAIVSGIRAKWLTANFTEAFAKSSLVMRGVCFDLNTIGIWYHAGFPVHARIAYARYLLHEFNAASLPEGDLKAKAMEVSSKGVIYPWGHKPAANGGTQCVTTSKLLAFFNEVRAAHLPRLSCCSWAHRPHLPC